jgi:hypothetical protein
LPEETMTVYMIRNKATGLYYMRQRRPRWLCDRDDEPGVWTRLAGLDGVNAAVKMIDQPVEVVPCVLFDADLVIAQGDGWQGVYVDGKLVREGTSIGCDVLSLLGITCRTVTVDPDWLDRRGTLPENLAEVVQ